MLSVTGIGIIPKGKKIKEFQTGKVIFMSFVLATKDPYKNRKQWIKVSVMVPIDKIEKAREIIKEGNVIQIRHADLYGIINDNDTVHMTVNTSWPFIEHLRRIPTPERKEEK